jgi:hypothetical protein
MNIFTDAEHLSYTHKTFALGFTAGAIAATIVTVAVVLYVSRHASAAAAQPVAAAQPEILTQTENETVARVHFIRDGRPVDCTLSIDHRARTWSLSR